MKNLSTRAKKINRNNLVLIILLTVTSLGSMISTYNAVIIEAQNQPTQSQQNQTQDQTQDQTK
jgi:hypothetical protein